MDSLMKSDIFFFVSTLSVILLTLALLIILGYLVYILNTLKTISKKARKQAELVEIDIGEMRSYLKSQGFKFSSLAGAFKKIFNRTKKSRES